MRKLILLLVVTLSFVGCLSTDQPAELIPKDKMANILFDMHIAEANTALHSGESAIDTLTVSMYQHIYDSYAIDSALFRKSFNYYAANPDQLEEIYRKLIEEVSKKQAEIGVNTEINTPNQPDKSAIKLAERIRSKVIFKKPAK